MINFNMQRNDANSADEHWFFDPKKGLGAVWLDKAYETLVYRIEKSCQDHGLIPSNGTLGHTIDKKAGTLIIPIPQTAKQDAFRVIVETHYECFDVDAHNAHWEVQRRLP